MFVSINRSQFTTAANGGSGRQGAETAITNDNDNANANGAIHVRNANKNKVEGIEVEPLTEAPPPQEI